MLAVPADRLPDAIGDLDPGNRALLDLSLRRGVSDAEIGELLRKEPADVARGRDAVLELLADALDVGGHDRTERVRAAVAALPDDAWQRPRGTGARPRRRAANPSNQQRATSNPSRSQRRPPLDRALDEDRARAARELDDKHRFEPEPKRSRRGGLLAVLGLLAVVAALVAAVLLSGDDDEPSGSGGNDSEPAQNGGPRRRPGNDRDALPAGWRQGQRRRGRHGRGSDDHVQRPARTPSPAPTRCGSTTTSCNSQSLGTVSGGSGQLEVKLPPDAASYRFLDVSHRAAGREPEPLGRQRHAGAAERAALRLGHARAHQAGAHASRRRGRSGLAAGRAAGARAVRGGDRRVRRRQRRRSRPARPATRTG